MGQEGCLPAQCLQGSVPALPPGLLWAHLVMPCHAGLPWAPHGLQESCRPGRGRVLGAPTVPELLGSHWAAPSLAASSPLGTPGCPPDPGFHCPVGCPAERGGRESGPWGAEGGHGGDSWDPSRPASALSWPKWEVPASRLRYWGALGTGCAPREYSASSRHPHALLQSDGGSAGGLGPAPHSQGVRGQGRRGLSTPSR